VFLQGTMGGTIDELEGLYEDCGTEFDCFGGDVGRGDIGLGDLGLGDTGEGIVEVSLGIGDGGVLGGVLGVRVRSI